MRSAVVKTFGKSFIKKQGTSPQNLFSKAWPKEKEFASQIPLLESSFKE